MISRIPEKLKKQMSESKFFRNCSLGEYHNCEGRITFEHALYAKGKRLNIYGSIIPLCAKGHGVDQWQDSKEELPKKMREWVALNLIDLENLKKIYPRQNWEQRKKYLQSLYGEYNIKKYD